MEQRLIDANAIPYEICLGDDEPFVYKPQIDAMPTIDPVKHGRWIKTNSKVCSTQKCSICGNIEGLYDYNFCPNCGARMDGEK